MTDRLDILNKPMKKAALFIKERSQSVTHHIENVLSFLQTQGCETIIVDTGSDFKCSKKSRICQAAELNGSFDCALSLGGDGTMLQAARILLEHPKIPIIGLHLGNLGFLTQIPMEHHQKALRALIEGRYRIKERMTLIAEVRHADKIVTTGYCLNEVVIHRKKIARIIDLRVRVQGMPLGAIRGDGVIIATPMGSTAYSLSAGGPIVHPAVQALIITSLAPHTLTHRPVVIPADYTVNVQATEEMAADLQLSLTLDGQEVHIVEGTDIITIRKSDLMIQFIDLHQPGRFFETLQDKLHWRI